MLEQYDEEVSVAQNVAETPGPAEAFISLLIEERDAARDADVDALVAVQEKKRAMMAALQEAGLPDVTRVELQRIAKQNVHLIRQLVRCLSGMIHDTGDDTYDALGKRAISDARGLRGTL